MHQHRHLAGAGRPGDCRDLLLSSPVILYDHPEVAPESAGELFDATEIDEILTLRTLALTDDERRQARATDQRAADLIDRLDVLPPEMLERMHGAIRYLSPTYAAPASAAPPGAPGAAGPWMPSGPGRPGTPRSRPGARPVTCPARLATRSRPGARRPGRRRPRSPGLRKPGGIRADTSVAPETDHVLVGGVRIARGSRVMMRPGSRRADAQDLFLAGREALVEAVLHDVDGHVHVAVSPTSDPLADLQRNHGRFLYFAPDEIEPVEAAPVTGGPEPSREEETE